MRRLLLLIAVTVLLLGGCGAGQGDTAAAIWTLAPGQVLDPQSRQFHVLVTRVGCNSGVTGQVEEPQVALTADRVVVTFVVTPGPPEAAGCPGNPGVPYLLTLPEPLGERVLADGQCLTDGEAEGTALCADRGLRHEP